LKATRGLKGRQNEDAMEWEDGNRYGDVEDRRGIGPVHIAGGGIGAAVLGLIGYFAFGINPFVIMNAVNQVAPSVQQQEAGHAGRPLGTLRRYHSFVHHRCLAGGISEHGKNLRADRAARRLPSGDRHRLRHGRGRDGSVLLSR
jgi:hypothetical protein